MTGLAVHDHAGGAALDLDLVAALPFALAAALYAGGALVQASRGRRWPWWRTALWMTGLAIAASGFVGPLAAASHHDFVLHMLAHLLVGMAAPLLLVLAAPITLALRSLPVVQARRLSRVLRSRVVRVVGSPVVAATLAVGGTWLLYATPLHVAMRESVLVHLAVMTHMLLAGVVFTVAIAPVDPSPHRAGHWHRMVVLVLALAAHGILAKALYASPPDGVGTVEGRTGAMLMSYGGDAVDAALLVMLCLEWYRAAGRDLARRRASGATPLPARAR